MNRNVDRNGAIQRAGQLLLQGWKMLATACPICATALMSKVVMKGDNLEEEVAVHLRCPSCDLPIKREKDVSEDAKAASAASQFDDDEGDGDGLDEEDFCSSEPEESSSGVGRGWDEDEGSAPCSLEEMKKEYDLTHRRREEVSAKMGDKMLAGWTMLARTCPRPDCRGTPLMQARGPEPRTVLCVSCDSTGSDTDMGNGGKDKGKDKDMGNGASRSPNPIQTSPPETETQTQTRSTAGSDRRWETEPLPPRLPLAERHSSRDPSMLISEKLLKGWALLDSVCGCSSTPLMRDRAGQVHCVSCGAVDGLGQVSAPVPPQREAAAPARRSSSPAQAPKQQQQDEEDEEEEGKEEHPLLPSSSSWSSAPAGRQPREQRASTRPASPGALDGSVEGILATLFTKLRWAAAALEESDSVAESVELAQLVKAVAEAIPAVAAAGTRTGRIRR
eukprot:gene24321-32758_t